MSSGVFYATHAYTKLSIHYTVSQKKLDPFSLSITLANTFYFNNFFTVAHRN